MWNQCSKKIFAKFLLFNKTLCQTSHPTSLKIGLLSLPEFPPQNNDWDYLLRDLVARLTYCIPTGVIAASFIREPSYNDPMFLRRAFLCLCITLFTFISLQIDWSVYTTIGREFGNKVGVFDWLIGFHCTGIFFFFEQFSCFCAS